MSNLGLERYLDSIGLTLERTQVGDRYVLEAMRAKGFNVGGEQSGPHHPLGLHHDGRRAGRGAAAAGGGQGSGPARSRRSAGASTRCRRCCTACASKQGKPLDHKHVVQVIAESRDRLGKGGRLVIRESGTEPVIRVMAESDDARLGRMRWSTRSPRRSSRSPRHHRYEFNSRASRAMLYSPCRLRYSLSSMRS